MLNDDDATIDLHPVPSSSTWTDSSHPGNDERNDKDQNPEKDDYVDCDLYLTF